MVVGLDGVFIGESFSTAQQLLGKPQPAIFRQVPAWQWKQPSGLVITAIFAKDGTVTLVDETAAATDDPTGIAEEDTTISGLMFNKDTHETLALRAPSTACKASAGTECWTYHYDRNIVLRAQFAAGGQGDAVLREATVAEPPLLQQLHFDE